MWIANHNEAYNSSNYIIFLNNFRTMIFDFFFVNIKKKQSIDCSKIYILAAIANKKKWILLASQANWQNSVIMSDGGWLDSFLEKKKIWCWICAKGTIREMVEKRRTSTEPRHGPCTPLDYGRTLCVKDFSTNKKDLTIDLRMCCCTPWTESLRG